MNLESILNNEALDALNGIKTEEERLEEIESQKRKEKRLKFLQKYCFKTRQELIDYVKAGNKLYEEYCGVVNTGYMVYFQETNEVGHYSMQYDKWCDMPLGYDWTYKTWEEFVEWTAWMDDPKNLEQGYIHYWTKERTVE